MVCLSETTPVIASMHSGVKQGKLSADKKQWLMVLMTTSITFSREGRLLQPYKGKAIKMNASAVVIARPGPLRDALQSLIMAVVCSGMVYQAQDVSTALPIIAEQHPALVVLDADQELSHESVWSAVSRMNAQSPQTCYVVLVEDIQQQQKANTTGVDTVLLKRWLPATQLFLLLEQLLSEHHNVRVQDHYRE